MFWDIKYISWIFCHKPKHMYTDQPIYICTILTALPDPFYLRVALLISFPELSSGGPELGVILAVIIVVLEWVICIIIIIIIIIPVLLLFLFLSPLPSLKFFEQLAGSMLSRLFIFNHLFSSAHCCSRMYLSHVINQLII